MNRSRNATILVVALAILIAALLLGCKYLAVDGTFRSTEVVTLDGAGDASVFDWVSSDHAFATAQPPPPGGDPGPPPPPDLPLPADVTFERGSAAIIDVAAVDAAIRDHVVAMAANPSLVLVVSAHASADGDDSSNLELSLHRGESVRDRFTAAGIDPSRVQVTAKGESSLPDPSDPEGPGNRVVILELFPGAGG